MRAAFDPSVDRSAGTDSHEPAHRHTSHEHEHEFEPQRGLPERLPVGERVLWQGAPDWRVLARECFHVRKLAVYFAALALWRVFTVAHAGSGAQETAVAGAMAVGLAAVALGLVTLMAWMSARTCLYTITNRRVVMRIGIVLSVTFNLPLKKVESAGLHPLANGHGDIALALDAGTRIAYPHLWPHARPWHVARTQPSLRCIADAASVARKLTDAWRVERSDVAVSVADARPAMRAIDAHPVSAFAPADRIAVPVASVPRPAASARPARAVEAAHDLDTAHA